MDMQEKLEDVALMLNACNIALKSAEEELKDLRIRETPLQILFHSEHEGKCPSCEKIVKSTTWRSKKTDEITTIQPFGQYCGHCGQKFIKLKWEEIK